MQAAPPPFRARGPCAAQGANAMKKRDEEPIATAKPRGRATVRLTVAEIWHEIVGVAGGDVTERYVGKAVQIIGGQGKKPDKPPQG
jgi:hypothetical protein